jgi:hypothetical protein
MVELLAALMVDDWVEQWAAKMAFELAEKSGLLGSKLAECSDVSMAERLVVELGLLESMLAAKWDSWAAKLVAMLAGKHRKQSKTKHQHCHTRKNKVTTYICGI